MSWVMCVLELAVFLLHPAFPLVFSTSSSTVLFFLPPIPRIKPFWMSYFRWRETRNSKCLSAAGARYVPDAAAAAFLNCAVATQEKSSREGSCFVTFCWKMLWGGVIMNVPEECNSGFSSSPQWILGSTSGWIGLSLWSTQRYKKEL